MIVFIAYQGKIQKILSKEPDLTDAEIAEILGIRYKKADVAVLGKTGQSQVLVFDDDFDNWIQSRKEGADSRAAEAAVITVDVTVE